ncbi:YagK/YfjJ domain-containing protein [Acinetobacter nectaris]|uniref:YagK/YfjJ domain-containing protein n=1 Tax=Acinetobacter nectaris TaxID=1219382 RepID=UPI001F40BA10|nr:inovirus-type Gp2 protein [Acinetobacter nectaris]MCF8999844.1 inovirus-type Gp2 protein [Acinetobacter nectaris]MCF9026757.1 inovirus-type Gp2 protein [Acinetobacter nectaris]
MNNQRESDLLIEIEKITAEWVEYGIKRSHRFYTRFASLLFDFNEIYDPSYTYFGYINAWCDLILDLDVNSMSYSELVDYIYEYSLSSWRDYLLDYKSRHQCDLRRHHENESRNQKSLAKRIRHALNQYSKSLVVRVDLAYSNRNNNIDIDTFYEDIRKLRNHLGQRRDYLNDLVDYAWALEQGSDKGYHCHVLMIFNGHKVQNGWGVASKLGRVWIEDITSGYGSYYNCHDSKQVNCYTDLGILGIGRIHRDDIEARERCVKAVSYLTCPEKEEQYLRVKCTKRMRTFN